MAESPLPASFLSVPAPETKAPTAQRIGEHPGLFWGKKLKPKLNEKQALGVSLGTLHSYNPGHWTFRKVPAAPVSRTGHEEMLPPRGHFLELQLQTWPLEALQSPEACEAVNETALQQCSQIGHGKQLF